MFLSCTTLPAFGFPILLSFLLLHYSPGESMIDEKLFDSCTECLFSPCAENLPSKCIGCETTPDYYCLSCAPKNGNNQFFSEEDCNKGCTDAKMTCVCDDTCYACVPKDGLDTTKFAKCNVLSKELLDTKCIAIPT